MKGSSKALLWVILVFATGSIFGSVVSFLVVRNRVVETVQQVRNKNPDPKRESRFLQRMVQQLDLDSEQDRQVRAILQRSHERVKQLDGERHKNLQKVRRETMREIRTVLRPEQQKELETFLKRLRRRSGSDRRDRRDPGSN